MKLTKGKISKAHKKKNQTMKKYKKRNGKKRGSIKDKTLRKKKATNLLKSTLKNYGLLGGADGDMYKLKDGLDLTADGFDINNSENYEKVETIDQATYIEKGGKFFPKDSEEAQVLIKSSTEALAPASTEVASIESGAPVKVAPAEGASTQVAADPTQVASTESGAANVEGASTESDATNIDPNANIEGVTGGVTEGVTGGVTGGVQNPPPSYKEANVDINTSLYNNLTPELKSKYDILMQEYEYGLTQGGEKDPNIRSSIYERVISEGDEGGDEGGDEEDEEGEYEEDDDSDSGSGSGSGSPTTPTTTTPTPPPIDDDTQKAMKCVKFLVDYFSRGRSKQFDGLGTVENAAKILTES